MILNNKTIAGVTLVIITLCQNCVQPPDYPDEPVIEFKSLSKSMLKQTPLVNGQDSLLITFSFTDGDGDLGFKDDEGSLFIIDGRDSYSKPAYRIPYIEQQGAGNGISGEISISVPTTCCIYPDPATGNTISCQFVPIVQDTLFYRISIKDRAGHVSNEIRTPDILLICKE